MKTAIAYSRFSSDNQREESIDAQLRAIKEYAERNGYVLLKTYSDEAKSATTDNRPQFQQLFKDIKTNSYDVLIVHKLDRFARDRFDSANYRHKLKESGMKLVSVLENLDGSPESIILESVLEGMAEYYSKNLAREVMKGLKETAYQGKHTGGVPPLGYDVDNEGNYHINPKESLLVKRIFEMYALGKSYREISEILNAEGCKTKIGKQFTKYSFHDLLRNEKYKGIYVFNKTAPKAANGTRNYHKTKSEEDVIRIDGGMPVLVELALWNEVNKIMMGNKRSGAKKAKRVYLLSGIIYCGECNSPMSGNTRNCGRNKDEYSTYDCNRRKREKTCIAKSINKDYVENMVLDYLINEFFTEENVEQLSQKLYNFSLEQLSTADSELPALKKELSGLSSEKENIIDAMIKTGVTDWLDQRALQVRDRMEYLQGRIDYLEKKQNMNILDPDKIKSYLLKDRDIKNKSLEGQKAVIQTYVEKVFVYHDHVGIHVIVDLNGEGEESRTPVRKHFHEIFSERS